MGRSTRCQVHLVAAFLVCCIALTPSHSRAAFYAIAHASGGDAPDSASGFNTASAHSQGTHGNPGDHDTSNARADARAFLGSLHVDASGSGGGYGGGSASADASFADEIVFDVPAFNGQLAYFYPRFYVRGAVVATVGGIYPGDSNASIAVTILGQSTANGGFNGSATLSASVENDHGTISYSGANFPNSVELFMPFIVGEPLTLGAYAIATAGGSGSGASGSFGMGMASFADTVHWGGVAQIFLEDGTPITDFQLTSESGTDYRPSFESVPEPATAFLFVLGLSSLLSRSPRTRDRLAR